MTINPQPFQWISFDDPKQCQQLLPGSKLQVATGVSVALADSRSDALLEIDRSATNASVKIAGDAVIDIAHYPVGKLVEIDRQRCVLIAPYQSTIHPDVNNGSSREQRHGNLGLVSASTGAFGESTAESTDESATVSTAESTVDSTKDTKKTLAKENSASQDKTSRNKKMAQSNLRKPFFVITSLIVAAAITVVGAIGMLDLPMPPTSNTQDPDVSRDVTRGMTTQQKASPTKVAPTSLAPIIQEHVGKISRTQETNTNDSVRHDNNASQLETVTSKGTAETISSVPSMAKEQLEGHSGERLDKANASKPEGSNVDANASQISVKKPAQKSPSERVSEANKARNDFEDFESKATSAKSPHTEHAKTAKSQSSKKQGSSAPSETRTPSSTLGRKSHVALKDKRVVSQTSGREKDQRNPAKVKEASGHKPKTATTTPSPSAKVDKTTASDLERIEKIELEGRFDPETARERLRDELKSAAKGSSLRRRIEEALKNLAH